MATRWEYCILTRLSAGIDTKWHANRVFDHTEGSMPVEVTAEVHRQYNEVFDQFQASKVYPILPAVLNYLGAQGWELLDDMQTGISSGESLVLRRELAEAPAPARRSAARPAKRTAGKKPASGRRR